MANSANIFDNKTPFYTFTLANKMPFYGCDRTEYIFAGRNKNETINRMMQFTRVCPDFNKADYDISVSCNMLIGDEPNYDNDPDPETKCKIITLIEDFNTWISKNINPDQTTLSI